jgi:Tripartite tricarboxylate transporter family receptor
MQCDATSACECELREKCAVPCTEATFRAEPDGYTLMMLAPSPFTVNAARLRPGRVRTGIDSRHDPDDGDIMFGNLGNLLPPAQSGQARLVAVATPKRLPALPEVPAIAETLPDFVSATWVGAFLPPKTPRAIAQRLSADIAEALRRPEIAQRFRDHGCEPVGLSPEATAAFVRGEASLWKRVIAQVGIKGE